jgi:hypothetical protein
VFARVEGEVDGVPFLADAVYRYPSIQAALEAGWDIQGTPTRGASVPAVLATRNTPEHTV